MAEQKKAHLLLAALLKKFQSIRWMPLNSWELALAAANANSLNTKNIYRAAKSSVVGTRLPITSGSRSR